MAILDQKILYFLKVVETGSFSGAARALYLSQPALSKQMAKLEQEVGFSLFDRSGYRPILTEKGKLFYQQCAKLARQCREMLAQIQDLHPAPLSIGFTGSFENREILDFLKEYQTSRGIGLNFVRGDFEQCLTDLLQGKVEVSLGIESTYRYSPGVEYEILHSYEMCVLTSLSHPLARRSQVEIGEIAGEGFLCLSPRFGKGFYKDYMAAFAKDHILPRIVKEVDSFDELVFSVSLGEGIAIASKNVAGEEVRAIPLQGSHHASNYVIACRRQESRKEVRELMAAAKAHFQR